jgi:hypothetical protein
MLYAHRQPLVGNLIIERVELLDPRLRHCYWDLDVRIVPVMTNPPWPCLEAADDMREVFQIQRWRVCSLDFRGYGEIIWNEKDGLALGIGGFPEPPSLALQARTWRMVRLTLGQIKRYRGAPKGRHIHHDQPQASIEVRDALARAAAALADQHGGDWRAIAQALLPEWSDTPPTCTPRPRTKPH